MDQIPSYIDNFTKMLECVQEYCEKTIADIGNDCCDGCIFAKEFLTKDGEKDHYCLWANAPDAWEIEKIKEALGWDQQS